MTYQSPRIYLYKITFEEVPYYYYGVHKEKYFNEEYWGSPQTHKWVWDFYTPKKQILQVFPYTDEGWLEAQKVEKRLIQPVFNTDKWCLNESCGGNISLECLSRSGNKSKELGVGVHGRTKKQMDEDARKGGNKAKELGVGVHARTPEKMSENGKMGGKKSAKLCLGAHRLTKEERQEIVAKTNSQKWMCLETEYITTSGPLTAYQRRRGINTSKRKRIS